MHYLPPGAKGWSLAAFNGKVKGGLRRSWKTAPARKAVLDRVRKEVPAKKKDGTPAKRPGVFYVCEACGADAKNSKSPNYPQIHVDHIEPVIPINRDIDWDEYIERLFCDISNLQALCDVCHKEKTKAENEERRKCRAERASKKS